MEGNKLDITKYPIYPFIAFFNMFIILTLYSIIGFIGMYIYFNIFNGTFVLVSMGILLGFIFQWAYNACHECLHRTFVKSKKVNEFLGVLLSTITILNFNMFKTYHLQHHANTFGEYETEPIEKNIGSFGEYLLNFMVPLFWVDNWMQSFNTFRNKFPLNIYGKKPPRVSKEQRPKIIRDGFILLTFLGGIVTLTVYYPFWMLFLYWIPLYTSFIFDFYFLLPRHYNVDRIPGINYQNAQTTISNPITRFFICNINYHTEHHINPGIAQHHLPKIHEILKKDMEHIQRSYMKFHLGLAKSYFR